MVDRRTRKLRTAAYGLTAVGLIFGIAADPLGWYGQYFWLDQVVHVYASCAVTFAVATHIGSSAKRAERGHVLWQLLLLAALGLGLGVLWEIGEWLYELSFGGRLIKSRYDTAADLAADVIGAFTGAALGRWIARPGPAWFVISGRPASI
jgi:hypothetical protein